MIEGLLAVTGGAGFIGSAFVRHVLAAHPQATVRVIDNLTYAGNLDNLPSHDIADGRLEVLEGDVVDAAFVRNALSGCGTVVHFAAETHVTRSIFDSLRFVQTDVLGTHALLTSCIAFPEMPLFVHISTSEVYGTALGPAMDEDHPLNPMSPYAAAKTGADRLVYSFHQTYGIDSVILRPFNNFGPRQHLEKVIPRFITSALTGLPLNVHGDGSSRRDFLFVEDTCRAIESVLLAPREDVVGKTFNVASGEDRSILEIAQEVLRLCSDSPSTIAPGPDRPGQVERHTGDYRAIRQVLGWAPSLTFAEGLELTCRWYMENEVWWRRQWSYREVPIRMRDGQVVIH